MTNPNVSAKQSRNVMVQFGDGAHAFLLPAGATLMELADRVGDLAAMHHGALISIQVELDTSISGHSIETRSNHTYH